MNTLAETINAFVEDTCVVVVLAVLVARGSMLTLLGREDRRVGEVAWLGVLFGAAGLTEMVFPGARFPYVTHTMIVTFCGLFGGLSMSLVASAVVIGGAFVLRPPDGVLAVSISVMAAALMGSLARRVLPEKRLLLGGLVAGTLAQVVTLVLRWRWPPAGQPHLSLAHLAVSLPANGVGVLLLALVVRDAQVRAASERHRADAEQARALAAQAQLSRLRARMHPHFLFNTLSSIAGLCGIAPEKAEAAIVRLGSLMRRVLETDTAQTVSLRTEIAYARDYLAIEQHRLGERLTITWCVDPQVESSQVPPFSLQTLLENAVGHGIAPKVGQGHLRVDIRRSRLGILIAVRDDGEGMDAATLSRARNPSSDRLHGLHILDQQLRMMYGPLGRLRLRSRPESGTLAAFVTPTARSAHNRRGS